MEVYHEIDQTFKYKVKTLATQVLDRLDHHSNYDNDDESSSPNYRVKLEINFTLTVNKKYYVNLSEQNEIPSIRICRDEEPVRRGTCTIDDVCWLDNSLDTIKPFLSEILVHQFEIHEKMGDLVAQNIIENGRKISKSDSKNGPKILGLKVDMKRDRIMELCESCSDEPVVARDRVIKTTLKRARVVADDDDHGEEECDLGRERKRRLVVQESEACPICMDEFVVGSKGVSSMPCSHVFHGKCIGAWLRENQPNCPICRYELPIEHGSQAKIVLGSIHTLKFPQNVPLIKVTA